MKTPSNASRCAGVRRRAQRLSASVMKTQYTGRQDPDIKMCSTPFGICDENTELSEFNKDNLHGCSTPFGICDENTCNDDMLQARRAQRLSASVMKHDFAWRSGSRCTVLTPRHCDENTTEAFRLMLNTVECSTPSASVMKHYWRRGSSRTSHRCSTPFGICDENTGFLRWIHNKHLVVLNAFRHL